MPKLPYEDRFKIAEAITDAAERYELDKNLPEIVFKYAGHYLPDRSVVLTELSRRSSKIKTAACREAYDYLKNLAADMETVDDVRKIAGICYNLEAQDGCYYNTKVARELPDPTEVFFCISPQK